MGLVQLLAHIDTPEKPSYFAEYFPVDVMFEIKNCVRPVSLYIWS